MATYYFRNVGINWGDATNWSLTDGGGATGTVPGTTDTARFTTNSGNCTINISTANCAVFDTTGYTKTITMSNNIDYIGTITLSSTTTLSGSGFFIIRVAGTITSNGVVIPGLQWRVSVTTTLADNVAVNSFSIYTIVGTTATINGNTLSTSGGLVLAGGSTCQGTTTINFIGSGTIDCPSPSTINNPVVFNASGTYTVNTFRKTVGSLTYTSGTITGTKLLQISGTLTLNCSGMTWNTIDVSNTGSTFTLTSDLNTVNLTLSNQNNSVTINGLFNVNISGTLQTNFGVGQLQGTSTIVMNGSANIIQASLITREIKIGINLVLNSSGTIDILNNDLVMLNSATLTYNSGTINWNGYYLSVSNCSLDLKGLTISKLKIYAAGITTNLNSNLSVSTDFVATTPTLASPSIIKSNVGGTQRKLTLNPAATMDIGFTNFTDIDASSGRKIWVWKPTLSNTNNIYSVSYTSFRQSSSTLMS